MDEEQEYMMSGSLVPSSPSTASESAQKPARTKRKPGGDAKNETRIGPLVGVGVFAIRAVEEADAGNFIVGRRKGSLGSGTWAVPGGHLEFGESFAECASRELEEETGLQLSPERMRYLTTVNTVFKDKGKKFHYVTILVGCGLFDGEEPELREPDKCEGWHWIYWDDMKKWAQGEYLNDDFIGDLFVPLQRLAETAIKEDSFDPFDPYEVWKAAEDKATILEDEKR